MICVLTNNVITFEQLSQVNRRNMYFMVKLQDLYV